METVGATSSLHSAVNSLLECTICLDTYEDPRILPCGHTFCFRCIQANIHRICALCNRPWSLPISGLQGLPKNYVLDSFISSLPSVTNSTIQTSSISDDCSKNNAKESDPTIDSNAIGGQPKSLECLEHSGEEVIMFCIQCQQCICQTCISTSHLDHSSISLKEADQHLTDYIKKSADALEKLASRYRKKMQKATLIMSELEKQHRTIGNVTNNFMNDVKQTLEATLQTIVANLDESRIKAIELINESTLQEKHRLAEIKSEAEDKLKRIQQLVQQHESYLSLALSTNDKVEFILSRSFRDQLSLKHVSDISSTQLTDVSKWQDDVTNWLQVVTSAMIVPILVRQEIENNSSTDPATQVVVTDDQETLNFVNYFNSRYSNNSLFSSDRVVQPHHRSTNDQQTSQDRQISDGQSTFDNNLTLVSNSQSTSGNHLMPATAAKFVSRDQIRSHSSSPVNQSLLPASTQSDASRSLMPNERVKAGQNQSVDKSQSAAASKSSSRTQQTPVNQPISKPQPVTSDRMTARDQRVSNRRSTDNAKDKHQIVNSGATGPSPALDMSRLPRLRAATFVRTLVIPQLKDNDVTMISAHKDKLLVSSWGSSQLYIYTLDGRYISTISVPGMLFDVTWTPRGDIACTIRHNHKVIILSQGGTIITQTEMTNPQCLSVSTNDVMHLADWQNGVYKSANGGASWSRVFQSREGVHCWQVIEIASNHEQIFWTLEMISNKYRLCAFNASAKQPDGSLLWTNVALPATGETAINLASSRLGHDGHANVFLTDQQNNAVHVFSMGGQYQFQLLSSQQINTPWRLAFNSNFCNKLLYVGQSRGEVKVFALAYI